MAKCEKKVNCGCAVSMKDRDARRQIVKQIWDDGGNVRFAGVMSRKLTEMVNGDLSDEAFIAKVAEILAGAWGLGCDEAVVHVSSQFSALLELPEGKPLSEYMDACLSERNRGA